MELQSRIKKTDILIQSREFRLETAVSRIDANGQLTTVKQKLFLVRTIITFSKYIKVHTGFINM